jgi:hypothetical protein
MSSSHPRTPSMVFTPTDHAARLERVANTATATAAAVAAVAAGGGIHIPLALSASTPHAHSHRRSETSTSGLIRPIPSGAIGNIPNANFRGTTTGVSLHGINTDIPAGNNQQPLLASGSLTNLHNRTISAPLDGPSMPGGSPSSFFNTLATLPLAPVYLASTPLASAAAAAASSTTATAATPSPPTAPLRPVLAFPPTSLPPAAVGGGGGNVTPRVESFRSILPHSPTLQQSPVRPTAGISSSLLHTAPPRPLDNDDARLLRARTAGSASAGGPASFRSTNAVARTRSSVSSSNNRKDRIPISPQQYSNENNSARTPPSTAPQQPRARGTAIATSNSSNSDLSPSVSGLHIVGAPSSASVVNMNRLGASNAAFSAAAARTATPPTIAPILTQLPSTPGTASSPPALATSDSSSQHAKSAKARLSEHKARAKADAARVALLSTAIKREKENAAARERYAHMARRSEVYALNHIKRMYHEVMFAQFMAAREIQTKNGSHPGSGKNNGTTTARTTLFDSDIASI